ncbi:Zn-ribbon domain-containing OB-fold protein [Nocardia nova]|uniref:Zn-ribbon domain-containing OB-fold protein n=1 Tax=Nocardia nova TaxID=37330 RepID=UPI0033FA6A81
MNVLPLQRDPASAAFFDAAVNGELLLRRCVPAAHWNPPSALICEWCGSAELDWVPARGDGRIVTWAVVHNKPGSMMAARVAVAVIELAEGPWLRGQVRPGAREITVGAPVRVRFDRAEDGEPIPVFHLVETLRELRSAS